MFVSSVPESLPLFCIYSHNTKTTTWLDPRLAKKAKPPEKCDEGGETLSAHTDSLSSLLTLSRLASRVKAIGV